MPATSKRSTKAKGLPPATTVAELRDQIATLQRAGSPSYLNVLKTLRRAELRRLASQDADALADDLDAVDVSWGVRLHLLFDDAGPEQTPLASRLRAAITEKARATVGLAGDEPADLDARIRQVAGSAQAPPLGAWIAAIWPRVDQEGFSDEVLEILRRLTKYDWSQGAEQPDERKQRQRYIAALVSPGFEPSQAVRGGLVLAKGQAVIVARARSKANQMAEKADELEDRRARLAREQRGLQDANASLAAENVTLRAQVEDLERMTAELQAKARHDKATVATRGQMQVSRTKERVLDVLDREVSEMRRYLDRNEPNVEGALSRLVHLERLAKWVREEV